MVKVVIVMVKMVVGKVIVAMVMVIVVVFMIVIVVVKTVIVVVLDLRLRIIKSFTPVTTPRWNIAVFCVHPKFIIRVSIV